MDVPGGLIARPRTKLYHPTFWPAQSFVHVRDPMILTGLAVFLGGPATAALTAVGVLEWIALRNAPHEKASDFLPILAHPASGTDPHEGDLDYAIELTPSGDAAANHLPLRVRHALRTAMFPPAAPDLDDQANAVVVADRADIMVGALKPAYRGTGAIARLWSHAHGSIEVHLRCATRTIRAASLCDACERDVGALPVAQGVVTLTIPGALASVRLHF
jgi:hypothetical protein